MLARRTESTMHPIRLNTCPYFRRSWLDRLRSRLGVGFTVQASQRRLDPSSTPKRVRRADSRQRILTDPQRTQC